MTNGVELRVLSVEKLPGPGESVLLALSVETLPQPVETRELLCWIDGESVRRLGTMQPQANESAASADADADADAEIVDSAGVGFRPGSPETLVYLTLDSLVRLPTPGKLILRTSHAFLQGIAGAAEKRP